MKIVLVSSALWISSLLVTGVLSADGDVGSPCATADTCSDGDAFCDTNDAASKKCRCRSGFVPEGAACARGWGRPCDRGMCLDHGVCTAQSTCSCDTDKHFLAGTNGSSSCACESNFALSGGMCLKRVGQPCSSSAECQATDGMLCADRGGTNKCTCDTTKHYAAGTDNATTCSCETGYAIKSDKSCGLVIGMNCNSNASCIDNALCANDTGTLQCQCDTTRNFANTTANATSCSCDSGYSLKANKSCGAVIGGNCTGNAACIDHAVCNSSRCECDASNSYAEGNAGDTLCSCNATTAPASDGRCLKRVGQPCSSSAECLATDGMLCADRGGTNKCTCDTTKHYAAGTDNETSCSCQPDHFKRADKVCGLVIGQNCTVSGKPCVDDAVCDSHSGTCTCDPAKFFLPGSDGNTSCSCDTSISVQKADGSCGLKVGQPCQLSSAAKACGPHATCHTTSYLCSCAGGVTKQNHDGTCSNSHAPGAGMSSTLLTSALLVASRILA